jgi:hypothetical protein
MINLSQDSCCPTRDSNQAPPKYESRVLLLNQSIWWMHGILRWWLPYALTSWCQEKGQLCHFLDQSRESSRRDKSFASFSSFSHCFIIVSFQMFSFKVLVVVLHVKLSIQNWSKWPHRAALHEKLIVIWVSCLLRDLRDHFYEHRGLPPSTLVQQEVLGFNLDWDISYPNWDFRCFIQSHQENSRIEPWLCLDHFLPNPFQFLSLIYHSTLWWYIV